MASQTKSSPAAATIDTEAFYIEWHGHLSQHLRTIVAHTAFSAPGVKRVWLAGDSSLDNKHWLFDGPRSYVDQLMAPSCPIGSKAVNGYEHVLSPPVMGHDVSFWCNSIAAEDLGPGRVVTINTSVEATTIADRDDALLPQDAFIRDNIRAGDFVVASLGGNDIALAPSTCTAVSDSVLF